MTVCQRSAKSSSPRPAGGDVATHTLNALVAQASPPRPAALCSTETYDRLLAGETVSWLRILSEHRMLGAITVPRLIAAGAVQMTPLGDDETHVSDARLRLLNRPRRRQSRRPLVHTVQERDSPQGAD